MSDFNHLGLDSWLSKQCSSLGMTRPTPVQQNCIPAIMEGKDVIGAAKTGSGKTLAFALPVVQTLSVDPYGIFALVLTPTRELAVQVATLTDFSPFLYTFMASLDLATAKADTVAIFPKYILWSSNPVVATIYSKRTLVAKSRPAAKSKVAIPCCTSY